jgi:hypothetical protein
VRRAIINLVLALAAAWLLSGCAAMRLAYDNADSYVRWRASSFLDLAGPDSEDLDERIDAFHAWHRAKALPQYARISEEAAKRIADGLSPQDLVWGYDSIVAQARESLRHAAEGIAPLLDKVGPEQVAKIERGIAEDNRKFAREYLRGSEVERRKKRIKRTVDRLEDWVGKLSPAQLERVREYSERAPVNEELRDRDRKRLQAEFVAIVRAREAQKRLPERMARWEQGREPAYAAAQEAWRKEYFSMLGDVDRLLSPEQRAKAVARFRSFAEDFHVLSGKPGGAGRP